MRINAIFNLLATCICLAASPSFAMESEDLSEKVHSVIIPSSSTQLIEPEVITPYDMSKISTLAVAVGAVESQIHFFGGRNIYAGTFDGFGTATINYKGKKLSNSDLKLGYDKDIPWITLNHENQIMYIFGENSESNSFLNTTDKQQALARQNRQVCSPMETNPQETIYLDLHSTNQEDFIHLKGDIRKINCLPNTAKVSKIIIEYLGDNLYAQVDFSEQDWSWLQHLHGLLNKGGRVLFEMRADSITRQDKDPILPPLTEDLNKAKIAGQKYQEQWLGKGISYLPVEKALMSPEYSKIRFRLTRALTQEETSLVMMHINPKANLPHPYSKIADILTKKFKENGFNAVSSLFANKRSLIPTRFYDTVVIEAAVD